MPVAIPGLGKLWLLPPVTLASLGRVPASGLLRVPVPLFPGFPTPSKLHLQAVIGSALSNPFPLRVE